MLNPSIDTRRAGENELDKKGNSSLLHPALAHNQASPNSQGLNSQFGRIEASFEAIASQHKLPHRRLLALTLVARYHGVPAGTFQKAFDMWLQASVEGGEG